MSNDTQRVDVLAIGTVLERAAWEIDADARDGLPGRRLSDDQRRELAEQLDRVSAAVAELIEATTEVRAAYRELPGHDHPAEVRQEGEARIGRAHYALEASVARIGGSK